MNLKIKGLANPNGSGPSVRKKHTMDFEDYLTLPSDITNTIAVVVTPYNEEKK